MRIPFNRICIGEKEKKAVIDALENGHLAGGGPVTAKVERLLGDLLGVRRVLATTSCTHALEMAATLSGLGEGDEVIMPSFTYPTSASCVLKAGAKPVFAEVAPQSMNAGAEEIMERLTDRTRAILAVHYGGRSKDISILREIADRRGLVLIEDAAQALGTWAEGSPLGTWGDYGCFSFHATKNFKAGEGGAIVFGSKSEYAAAKAESIRNGGTDKESFKRGERSFYQWVEEGSMYLPSDLLMALLSTQLEEIEAITARRQRIFKEYEKLLKEYEGYPFIDEYSRFPEKHDRFNAHLFYIVFDKQGRKEEFQRMLKESSIQAFTHYTPLHESKMGKSMGWGKSDLPRTSRKASGLVRLPLYENLKDDELEYVLANVRQALDTMARGE